MTREREAAVKDFVFQWNEHGNESSDYQDFWRDLLHDVLGVERTTGFIKFLEPVDGTLWRMDAYIPITKVLIEHKSFGVDLSKRLRQSDGEYLTPLEQAQRYADNMIPSKRPRWIVTCNFSEFRVYDLAEMNALEFFIGAKIYEPMVIKLEHLRHDYRQLDFLVNPNAKLKPEIKISGDAAEIVRKICLALDKNYAKLDDERIDALSKLCARLVFCFYADDEKLFTDIKFGEWFEKIPSDNLRDELQKLFDVLNTPDDKRPKNLDADLKKFPRVNGGLFAEEIKIPELNELFAFELRYAHTDRKHLDADGKFLEFSWRGIDPTIFGAMFESVFNAETRRGGGIHYTTVENIHKVIDPLFLDELNEEFIALKHKRKDKVRLLKNFQDKIASLNFLDPACGSGNFLTETYLSLRALENQVLAELRKLHVEFPDDPIKVTPRQFYGIEISGFAAAIARLALWISEIQMRKKTAWVIGRSLDQYDFPLRPYISVRRANALRLDWSEVVAPANVDYIIGNPPFIGASMMTAKQKDDAVAIFGKIKLSNSIDYVGAWYHLAAKFIKGTKIRCAFVSTNSITQGEQVTPLWKKLFDAGIHIDFAHKTFKWLSDSNNMAHVHCVVVGFSRAANAKPKKIFVDGKFTVANNINAYLFDAPTIFIESRAKHFQGDVPRIFLGNKPSDGGNLILSPAECEELIRHEPTAAKWIRRYVGGNEFINNVERYCLWLVDATPAELRGSKEIYRRLASVKKMREASTAKPTRDKAATPQLFFFVSQPSTNYILIPMTSSENRRYVPIGFMPPEVIASNAALIVPDAQIYHFGILTSSIHMAWMRTVCGRLKSDYRYSAQIVYNNFPWPTPTPEQRRMIEESAQKILDVRKKFQAWTFAALYNEDTMPDELRWAHKSNDYAVALAYGFEKFSEDESKIVAELMKLYAALTKA